MNAWLLLQWTRELWMHSCCCCYERVSYECMAAVAMNAWMHESMNAWICELWMHGYVSYECVSYGHVRVNVVAMNAWKHGSIDAWVMDAWMLLLWMHGSMNAWMLLLWMHKSMKAWICEYVSYGCVITSKVAMNTNVLEFVYIRVNICYCINV